MLFLTSSLLTKSCNHLKEKVRLLQRKRCAQKQEKGQWVTWSYRIYCQRSDGEPLVVTLKLVWVLSIKGCYEGMQSTPIFTKKPTLLHSLQIKKTNLAQMMQSVFSQIMYTFKTPTLPLPQKVIPKFLAAMRVTSGASALFPDTDLHG